MSKVKYKIITDSASDLSEDYLNGSGIGFAIAPLTIRVGAKEFVDEPALDPQKMLAAMHASKEKSSSACPSPDDFRGALTGADYYFIVTLTGKLSGCYNSAKVGIEMSGIPADRVLLLDSRGVSGSEILLVDELARLIGEGKDFETVSREISQYSDRCELLFLLQRFDNLIANGRMNKFTGLIASTLMIRLICRAEDGVIEVAKKVIGANKTFNKLVELTKTLATDITSRQIIITQCEAEAEAARLAEEFSRMGFSRVRVLPMRGLTSFYALEKGIIVCF